MDGTARQRIYLDHNASSPMVPEARAALLEALAGAGGNPSSMHQEGQTARRVLDRAREQVAALLKVSAGRIFFTSGGSEANNWAVKGTLLAAMKGARTDGGGLPGLILSPVEHPSVVEPCRWVAQGGAPLRFLPTDQEGQLHLQDLDQLLCSTPKPALVAVMLANNETGIVHSIAPLAGRCREAKVPFLCDCVQGATTLPLRSLAEWGVSLVTLSAHKLGGPQGMGCLYVAPGTPLEPWLHGGFQERGMRSGTQATALAAAFGAAAERCAREQKTLKRRLESLQHSLETSIRRNVPGITLVGASADRLATTTCLLVEGVEGATLVAGLDMEGIAISSGSACAQGSTDPSPVLRAMGFSAEEARSGIRISLGQTSTPQEVDHFIEVFGKIVARCRRMSPPTP